MTIHRIYLTDESLLAVCGHVMRGGAVLHLCDSYVYCSKECADVGDHSWVYSSPSDGDLFLKTGDRRFDPDRAEAAGAAA